MLLWGILAVVAAVVVYAIVVFNGLVRTRQMANEAWSGIDVQLKRRSDLVPNLVDSVKGYAGHERSVLEEVTGPCAGRRARCQRTTSPAVRRPKALCRSRSASSWRWPRATRTSRPAAIFSNCSSS